MLQDKNTFACCHIISMMELLLVYLSFCYILEIDVNNLLRFIFAIKKNTHLFVNNLLAKKRSATSKIINIYKLTEFHRSPALKNEASFLL